MNDAIKTILLWMVIGIILISVFNNFGPRRETEEKISYSAFLQKIKQGDVNTVTISDQNVTGKYQTGKTFTTYLPMRQDPVLLKDMLDKGVIVQGKQPDQPGLWVHLLNLLPWIIIIAIWIYVLRQQTGGGKGGAFSFGRSRARLLNADQVKITFSDVAGCEEAKEEVKELVDFLKDPGKFQRLGGKIPRGVLLVGPPGTGKTLLAKAVAGEAKVPFFTISGSDFVEMFVGVGASRVRDMFDQAKKQAPCIIFIDEIDAVGRHRGAGLGGGHDEREQTLNQLLVEMDGFQGSEGVIVIAATNRPDVLDPALLRPGRFDRQVVVGLPDVKGREQILRVHSRKLPLADDVDVSVIARGTPGFSGADLANIVNEAALFAARSNKRAVDMDDFEKAKDKVIMGTERRSIVMSEQEKKLTAYHEAGHAIVGLLVPEHDPVHKVTIIPRGRALGVTMFLPEGDRYNYTREYLESKISSLFGGRLAEEIIFGDSKVTTGASNDIQKASELARNMVTKWGLSEKVGPLTIGGQDEEVFLGHSITRHKEVSEATFSMIDAEVREIIDRNYKRAERILKENIEKLHAMAEALVKYETINLDQIHDVMEGKTVREPANWQSNKENSGKAKPKVKEKEKEESAEDKSLNANEGAAQADGSSVN
ncbi:ATP-dependent zinc metalloprotease FtsH [Aquicella lusitana]|uniref:ATP-dependent zinc metalloprotease FtsH n=1 Tax=Aquicella lusitana TaxID=254246 RepID=A0A370GWI9_9COXI|nr:ATP-dependent zinc metalloprotease FtsH [Aquicella lusitana]RDI48038.1 membrane protease FtsH catalytic subunit [Aquicella lusitana]VVC72945.1 ATP-dependent zinc metalloprotease FtsH [Aquicella lusitana]